jgi:hypothetical protein
VEYSDIKGAAAMIMNAETLIAIIASFSGNCGLYDGATIIGDTFLTLLHWAGNPIEAERS